MSKLLKEAIADAKAVREIALRNAKMALEEAFAPKLQSMLSAKIQNEVEGEDDDELETNEVPGEEGAPAEVPAEAPVDAPATEEAPEEQIPTEEPTEAPAEVPAEAPAEAPVDAPAEAPVEEPAVEEVPPAEDEQLPEEGFNPEEEADDLDLESIIRELESEVDNEDELDLEAFDAEEPTEEVPQEVPTEESVAVAPQFSARVKEEAAPAEPEADDEINIDEILRELSEEDKEEKPVEEACDTEKEEEKDEEKEAMKEQIVALESELKAVKSSLDEHVTVVKFFRSKLNELNLLNSKLLFTNKLFKTNSLSDEQKMKVIENFDRAKSIREVKLVYTTLAESFNQISTIKKNQVSKTVKNITESFASKQITATRVPAKPVITENTVEENDEPIVSNELATRLKKLANIKS